MLEVLLTLVVMAVLVVLVKMAVLAVLVMMAVLEVLVMMAVLEVLVVTGSSCFTDMTTTPTHATNTNNATPIIMNFRHFTDQPSSS